MQSPAKQQLPVAAALLLPILCLLAPQPALCLPSNQTTYHCDRSGRPTSIPGDLQQPELLLQTNYPDSYYLSPNMRCQFAVAAPASGFLYQLVVERNPSLQWVDGGARLVIRDAIDGRVLAASEEWSGGRRVPDRQTVLVTRPGRPLSVTFDTAGGPGSQQEPVWLRLRRFVNCPPGWTDLDGYCFSPLPAGTDRQLDFTASQAACNSMRANLLTMSFHGGSKYIGNYSLATFFNTVLGRRTDAWVGLTDRSQSDHSGLLVWLDGSPFRDSVWPDGLRCASSLSWPGSRCYGNQRCAFVRPTSAAAFSGIVLDSCEGPTPRRFICYMPRNGTDVFYRVPRMYSDPLLHWLLPTVLGCCLIGGALLMVAARRRRQQRRRLLLLGGGACAVDRQPILAVPQPVGYDVFGRPIPWYGGGGGQVQHQQPPHLQHPHAYQTFGSEPPVPPPYSPQQHQEKCEKS